MIESFALRDLVDLWVVSEGLSEQNESLRTYVPVVGVGSFGSIVQQHESLLRPRSEFMTAVAQPTPD